MFNKKMQYIIKSVPTDDKQALENLLNEMSEAGWDLYTMHEVETDSSFDFNCIFMREKQDEDSTDLDDIVNITSFKYRMEKMLAAPSSPYASCKEIQLKISNQKERIKKIKSQLESENLSPEKKKQLNNQMSDELRQLDGLKQALVNEISPDAMYSAIKEEKFVVNLSEEILEVISMEANDNLLAETVRIRQDLAERLGYVIPHIHFHNSDELMQNEFSVKIHDIEVFRSVVFPGYVAFYKDDPGHQLFVQIDLSNRSAFQDAVVNKSTDYISSITNISQPAISESIVSFSYSEYISTFLFIELCTAPDDIYKRTADVIQTTMAQNDSEFVLSKSLTYYTIETKVRVKPMMMTLPYAQQSGVTVTDTDTWNTFEYKTSKGY